MKDIVKYLKNTTPWGRKYNAEAFQPLSIQLNFIWNFTGYAVYGACQWGMMVLLAKLTVPEIVGQFALGMAICTPVLLFSNLQLRTVQATDANRLFIFDHYLTLRVFTTILAFIIIIMITLIAQYSQETKMVILATALFKAVESFNDIYYGLFQAHERFDRICVSMINKGILSLISLALGIYLTGNIFWGLILISFFYIINLFLYDIPQGSALIKNNDDSKNNIEENTFLQKYGLHLIWDLKPLKQLTWLAFPLGLVMVINSLNANVPRYLIERWAGERDLGIFSAIAYPMLIGGAVVFAMGSSATPRLSKYYAQNNYKAFRYLLLKLLLIGSCLAVLGFLMAWTLGEQILTILYKPEYAQHNDVFLLLMIAAGISYLTSPLGYGADATRYFKVQMPISMITLLCTLACSAWLIPLYGLWGAALGLVIAALINCLGYLIVLIWALKK
jgi:O-antigen/teichoic acid export membrane protein